ncbi:M20/M25/M40 family metallo-hydrolase [Mesonia aquimarina]|uniref:M20/M25/M40 family metallo-hydrolase n=1 Tax=Mesonia aquimarina TaxID=1504967 RepID=UPI000EF5E0EE|nr:M20/M25/M40 family metallo-hydrolase [Mesonia aquimarina]
MRNLIIKSGILVAIAFLTYISFNSIMPQVNNYQEILPSGFSMQNAFLHVQHIGKKPHSIGTQNHSEVRNYIVKELQELGLQVQTQKDYQLSKEGTFTAPENIITRLEGSNPKPKSDLLILTHYDSAVHSSPGASDAGSGVATILESLRVFLKDQIQHKNNIIICFTDAEEIGLNGAALFAEQHPWAENIGLVLNFEARGSGGPSNTILETNSGNSALIKAFDEANPRFPNATSLMYSVYKKLPNDTDATVFREEKDIPSFFFAFIDDHFDYHTANDTPQNLDANSLAHQATYLSALLPYFGNKDLSKLNSTQESVYFNFPFIKFVHYPYNWIFPTVLLAWGIFIGLIIYGFRKKRLTVKNVFKSFIPLFISLFVSGIIGFFTWPLLNQLYVNYQENLNGFPANGHFYIGFIVFLTLSICFFLYHNKSIDQEKRPNIFVAPLFIWLVLNTFLAFALKGAAYFIIPMFFSFIGFFILIKKANAWLGIQLLLATPAVFIFAPLIQFFPVGLGLKMLVISAIFTVLLFGLLLPVFSFYQRKKVIGFFCLMISLLFFILGHSQAKFSEKNQKPNSLVYLLDVTQQKASWNTYDHKLDDYTKNYLAEEHKINDSSIFHSKYNNRFTYAAPAPVKAIPSADFFVDLDSTIQQQHKFTVKIVPTRDLNRLEIFADTSYVFSDLSVNGKTPLKLKNEEKDYFYQNRKTNKLLTYYAIDRDTLRLSFTVEKDVFPELSIYGASNDLLKNDWLSVPKRTKKMMPKPFVLNDAIITKQKIDTKKELK